MNKLWNDWKKHYGAVGIDTDLMCYDGILDVDRYKKSKHKLLFITKDTNDFHQRDKKGGKPAHLRDLYENGPYANFGYTISRLATGLLHKFPHFDTIEHDETILKESLLSVAIINIKKISGKAQANWEDLTIYSKFDRDFLIKQIKEINPEIILTCGNTNEVIWLLDIDVTNWMKKREDGAKAHDLGPIYLEKFATWLIPVLHPSSYFSNQEKYNKLKKKVFESSELKKLYS